MRLAPFLPAALCVAVLPACGGSTPAARPPVRVTVSDPADQRTVRDGAVDVRGTVRPARATVTVHGQPAQVNGGSFHARVPLQAGVNVIDVLASDGGARPALTAVRVKRIITVAVPDVLGLSPDDARKQLEAAGLKADTQQAGGGFLDQFLGQSPQVCQTSPPAGDRVDPGTTVTVIAARRC
jgi:hypothetical protein